MIKKYSIIFLLLMTSYLNGNCQDNVINISSYEEFVNLASNLKKSLVTIIELGNVDSINTIIETKFIFRDYEFNKSLTWLSNGEKTLIYFYTKKYDSLFVDIAKNRHYFNDFYLINNEYFYSLPQLNKEMKEFWLTSSERILYQIKISTLNANEKELLIIYWKSVINNLTKFLKEIIYNQDSLNDESTKLIENDVNHEYNSFIKTYLRYIYRRSDWAFGADIIPGQIYYFGDLSNHFKNNFALGEEIDIFYKNWNCNFHFYGFHSNIIKEIEYNSTWNSTGHIRSITGGINVGYSFMKSDKFGVTPTGGISLGSINYFENDSIVERTAAFLQPNIALNIDYRFNIPVKRFREKNRSFYYSDKEILTWYLRCSGRYYPLGFNNLFSYKGSILFFNIGLGVYWSYAKRKL